MEFSKKVKTARVSLGISQEELAKRLNVSFATINRWENGKTTPNNLTQKVFISQLPEIYPLKHL
ncbi:helix-turn-helix transcriptional regulator [Chakrabartyella piscis]|uniref:helix-turn-helix domain-containing protein n=1 Tax=Chakrabartyella piscis TaxID=2918914 RepID=UPI00295864CB|nr:helix-turn-helix transcriptional regulator [Chakrabartyella piscis]